MATATDHRTCVVSSPALQVLVLYLTAIGFSESEVGLIFMLTLLGDGEY